MSSTFLTKIIKTGYQGQIQTRIYHHIAEYIWGYQWKVRGTLYKHIHMHERDLHACKAEADSFACCLEVESDKRKGEVKIKAADPTHHAQGPPTAG